MVLFDDRFVRAKMIWGMGPSGGYPVRFANTAAEHAAVSASEQRGQQFWSYHGRGENLSNYIQAGQIPGATGPAARYAAGLVDLGYTSEQAPSYGGIKLGGDDDLGYVVPVAATKHGANKQVVVTGPTTTHTLNLNLAGGGIIDSWTINNGSFPNVQMLNRYDSYTRGIQCTTSWVDALIGELVKHQPMQGGNYYSLPTKSTTFTAPGSIVLGAEARALTATSTEISVLVAPLEFDPDGAFAMPGLNTYHNGSQYHPVIWKDLRLKLTLTINYQGIENFHRLDVSCYYPWEIKTAWFDTELYAACFLDAAQFAELWAYNPATAASTQVSNGVAGGTHFRDAWRTYHMNAGGVFENDVGFTGSAFLPAGTGVLGARGASANDLAFAIYAIPSDYPPPTFDFSKITGGNCWVWSQKRDGASGKDGDNYVALAQGAMLTTRLHDATRVVTIPKGWSTNTRYLVTDSWTNVLAKVESVKARGMF